MPLTAVTADSTSAGTFQKFSPAWRHIKRNSCLEKLDFPQGVYENGIPLRDRKEGPVGVCSAPPDRVDQLVPCAAQHEDGACGEREKRQSLFG